MIRPLAALVLTVVLVLVMVVAAYFFGAATHRGPAGVPVPHANQSPSPALEA